MVYIFERLQNCQSILSPAKRSGIVFQSFRPAGMFYEFSLLRISPTQQDLRLSTPMMNYWVYLQYPRPQVTESVGLVPTPVRHPPLLDLVPLMPVAVVLHSRGSEFPFSFHLSPELPCFLFLLFPLFPCLVPLYWCPPLSTVHPGRHSLWDEAARLGVSLSLLLGLLALITHGFPFRAVSEQVVSPATETSQWTLTS